MGTIKCETATILCNPPPGITRTFRDLRPTHYLFKVVSYSSLEDECYESDLFQVGDYKWKLCLYPNGDTKRYGNDHVSLYLQIEDTNTLPCGWETKVEFKLFVYDQINDKYLTIQGDGERAIRRFHEAKTQWGFPKLVPLDIFKDVTNGYLIDDCCEFGAEVFVLKSAYFKSYCLLPKPKTLSVDTYTWKLEKISTLQDEFYVFEAFTLLGKEWKLKVFLNGNKSAKGKAMSLYLQLENVPKDFEVTADFSLYLKDQVSNKHVKKSITDHLFTKADPNWGYPALVRIDELHDPLRGFVKDDTLVIEVQLMKLSLVPIKF